MRKRRKEDTVNWKAKEKSLQKKYNIFHDGEMLGKHDKRFCDVCEYSNDEMCIYAVVAGKKDKKHPCARAYEKLKAQETAEQW